MVPMAVISNHLQLVPNGPQATLGITTDRQYANKQHLQVHRHKLMAMAHVETARSVTAK